MASSPFLRKIKKSFFLFYTPLKANGLYGILYGVSRNKALNLDGQERDSS